MAGDGEINNEIRANYAREAIEAFVQTCGTDACDAVGDLLCDLMHLCGQAPGVYGQFADALRKAQSHYAEELSEAEGV